MKEFYIALKISNISRCCPSEIRFNKLRKPPS
jgi:hypothetical protein